MNEELSSRERVLKSLNNKKPDRVPMDLGGTIDSSIVKEAYDQLRTFLGLSTSNSSLINKMMRVVKVESDILNRLDIDTRGIFPGAHSDVEMIDSITYKDEWGVIRTKKENVPYFEQINAPLGGNITKNDIINYDWPDPDDKNIYKNLKNQIKKSKIEGDYALVLSLPSPFVHKTQYLRGFEDWYLDCASDIKTLELLFDSVLDISLQMASNILEEVGKEIDIVLFADDLGTQNNLQISPNLFRRKFKPRLKKYIDVVKSSCSQHTKLLFHSCGSINKIINDLIEIGVDILNPVQVTAKGMEPRILKEKYGDNICFWGGIDTQKTLCRGDSDDVKKEVKRMIKILGENGGYILGAVHNIQPDVPAENVVNMFDYAKKFSKTFY